MRHDHHPSKFRSPWLFGGIFGLLVTAIAGPGAAAPDKPREMGIWYNHSGKGAVEIRPCGDTGRDAKRLCGFIVWLREPNNKRGEPLTDGYNPQRSKRRRPICGLPVLGSLRPMSDGSWDQGWVYDPEQGQSFDAAIELRSHDRLILTGYKGVKFFSKSFLWKRAPDDLPRCDGKPVERQARASLSEPLPPLPDKASRARAPQTDVLVAPRPVPAVRPSPSSGSAVRIR